MASIIKVDTIQDQDGNNIISEAANTITIGASGDTITIPSGATLANSGIVTGFQSTGIDDNATSTVLTVQNDGLVSGTTATYNIGSSSNQWNNLWLKNGGRVYFADTGTAIYGSNSLDIFTFSLNSSERMRLDTTGLGIGTSSPSSKLHVYDGGINVDTTGGALTATRYTSGTGSNNIILQKSQSDTIGTQSALNPNGSGIGGIITKASDGTSFINTTAIFHQLDGTVSTNSVPSRITFSTNGGSTSYTERMRITSGGLIGIGTSSPSAKLEIETGSDWGNIINSTYAGTQYFQQFEYNGTSIGKIRGDNSSISIESGSNLIFQTANTERMNITSGGNILIGTTGNGTTGGLVALPNNNNSFLRIGHVAGSGSTSYYHQFFYNGSQIGSIWQNGTTGVSYNTSSDYRLKENIVPINSAIDRVKALNPVRFNFKSEPDRIVDGFLAHEAQSVVPEAVGGTKDEMSTEEYEITPAVLDEDGNVITEAVMGTREVPLYQGIDQSKLVPLLTAGLKEAIAKIETLEARITALETQP